MYELWVMRIREKPEMVRFFYLGGSNLNKNRVKKYVRICLNMNCETFCIPALLYCKSATDKVLK